MGNGKSLAFKIVNGKWVKDEEEAKLGKKIFELYLEYDSIRKVRDWVNEHGYTNSVGKPFTSESISRILKNEKAKGVIVMGKYHHDFDKKKIVRRSEEELVRIPAPELAYVSEEVFDKVQERLRAKTGNGRGVNAYSDPLSGKIYCGSCGRKLWKHASNGYVNWMCASQVAKGDVECNGTRITTVAIRNIYKKITDNLEVNKGVVKQDIVKWLNELKATLSDTSVNEKIQKDLDKLERKRTKLLEAYLEDFISKDDYKAKYEAIEGQIEEKKKLLVPVEENEDIKVIESVLQNIDDEIDAYVKTLDMEESKVDFLIEHTKRITVLENRDIIIELDLVAGAIIAGKDFLLYVHDTMSFPHGRICYEKIGIRRKFCRSFSDRFRCHQHGGDWNGIGNPVYPPAKAELARHGISCEGKRARQVTKADYAEYDYLIGMDSANIRNMLRIFGGDPDGKVARLLSYAGSERDISDPWYTGEFGTTYNDVLEGCTAFLRYLQQNGRIDT